MTKKQNQKLAQIHMLVMDVDGVLTDGTIIINADGTESKRFSLYDGHGIKMWHRAGLMSALISGRESVATSIRADQLKIKHVLQGCKKKLPAFESLLSETGLSPYQVAYIGDDLLDLPIPQHAEGGIVYQALEDPDAKMKELETLRKNYARLKRYYDVQQAQTHSYND